MKVYVCAYSSPVGELGIASSDEGLLRIDLQGKENLMARIRLEFPNCEIVENIEVNRNVMNQLDEYFTGKRSTFDLKLHLIGTEFRKKVWKALQAVPYGQTVSYGDLARQIGKPRAARAVGQANHHNPVPIVIPCHRVIGANGHLTGFGGGLEMKEKLLKFEKAL